MKLCVMRGQMRAKTPDGRRLRIIFKDDPAYDMTAGFPCYNCAALSLGCDNYRGQCCVGTDRTDEKSGGIWVPETV